MRMSEYTKDEAIAFVEAMRLNLAGRVGFKWFTERLGGLGSYIESVSAENEQLNAYLDASGNRDDFAAFRAKSDGDAS
jgi:hypothetical protein